MIEQKLNSFVQLLVNSLEENSFIGLALMNKKDKESDLKSMKAKVISTKKGDRLSVVYRHTTKDITKNYGYDEVEAIVKEALEHKFFQAELNTTKKDYYFAITGLNIVKIKESDPKTTTIPEKTHNKAKNRLIDNKKASYLQELGVLDQNEKVKNDKQDKFKQINKFVEIIDGLIKDKGFEKEFTAVDMGSGKGYLTFALYDYLSRNHNASIKGIEIREDMVNKCNKIAQNVGFENLSFHLGSIQDFKLEKVNLLIALHACDTATDDAIFKGIKAGVDIIVCAPCCQKQVRKSLKTENALSYITKHGILEERQAEILTDTIRSLILEAHGYKTKVFEFISTTHTPKNVMIIGEKVKQADSKSLEKVAELKKLFGLKNHYLEDLLASANGPTQ